MYTNRLAFGLALAVGATSQAAVIASNYAATFPTSNAIVAASSAQATSGGPTTNGSGVTQTFQVTGAPVMLTDVYLDYKNLGAGDLTLNIFTVTDTNASSLASVTSLLTQTVSLTSPGFGGTQKTLDFSFSGSDAITLPVTAGTAGYAIQFIQANGQSGQFDWQRTGNDTAYAGGTGYTGSGKINGSGRDLSLAVALSPVPEPASLGLLGLGGLTLLKRRRRA